MNDLPFSIQEKIDRYEPINTGGITTYPIRVKQLRLFAFCTPVLDFIQQSLPVALLSIPLLDAFYKLDMDELKKTGQVKGLISASVLLLGLALRLGDGLEPGDIAEMAVPLPKKDDPDRLDGIAFYPPDGAEPVFITPILFSKLRKIIAAQNGVELVSETANPEIIAAERLMAQNHADELEPSLPDKVIFASQATGTPEEEIYDWPILKMERHVAVYKRTLDYSALLTAEASGMVQFKGGNPVPSPYFARRKDALASMQSIGSVGEGRAENAVSSAAQQTNKE